jgi:hypothetical protein
MKESIKGEEITHDASLFMHERQAWFHCFLEESEISQ